jgi:hypothetical protein
VNLGFGLFRFNTISWCLNARFSIIREFRCRSNPISHFEIISIQSIMRIEPIGQCHNVNGINCDDFSGTWIKPSAKPGQIDRPLRSWVGIGV